MRKLSEKWRIDTFRFFFGCRLWLEVFSYNGWRCSTIMDWLKTVQLRIQGQIEIWFGKCIWVTKRLATLCWRRLVVLVNLTITSFILGLFLKVLMLRADPFSNIRRWSENEAQALVVVGDYVAVLSKFIRAGPIMRRIIRLSQSSWWSRLCERCLSPVSLWNEREVSLLT